MRMMLVLTSLQCPAPADAVSWTPLSVPRTGNVLLYKRIRSTDRAVLGSCNFVHLHPFHPFANLFPLHLHLSSGTLGDGDLTTLAFDMFRCCFHECCPDGEDVHLLPTRCARRCGGIRHVRERQACDERRAGRTCDVCEHAARVEAVQKNRRRWVPTRGGGVQHPFACRPACRRLQGHLRLQPCSN